MNKDSVIFSENVKDGNFLCPTDSEVMSPDKTLQQFWLDFEEQFKDVSYELI